MAHFCSSDLADFYESLVDSLSTIDRLSPADTSQPGFCEQRAGQLTNSRNFAGHSVPLPFRISRIENQFSFFLSHMIVKQENSHVF